MYMVMLFPQAEHPLSDEVRTLPPKMQDIFNLPSMMNKKKKEEKSIKRRNSMIKCIH